MQELIDYFTESLKYDLDFVNDKLNSFNTTCTDSGSRFAFLVHLSTVIGDELFNKLIKTVPELVQKAEHEYTLQLVKHDNPHLTDEDLSSIVIKKYISPQEFILVTKLESQLAGIKLDDLIFLDMLADQHPALNSFSDLRGLGKKTGTKFLKYITKIYNDDDLQRYIDKKNININDYIVELAKNNRQVMPLRFIDWDHF